MSTIQQIVDNLVRQSEEKTAVIKDRYEENSMWLANELELIRKIILKNPREDVGTTCVSSNSTTNTTTTATEEVSNAANSTNATASNNSSNNNSNNFQRVKRKSPEVGLKMFSPDYKRSSADYEQLAVHAGLPADLNKLKKEQLLAELEARGVTSYSMKALKKDLIDGLKEALVAEYQQKSNENQVSGVDSIADVSVDPSHSEESDSLVSESSSNKSTEEPCKAPVRKGSLISALRHSVLNPVNLASSVEEESEESRKQRLESEFQARQQRHRSSLLRQSQGDPFSGQGPSGTSSMSLSPQGPTASNTWMDVSSPVPHEGSVASNGVDLDSVKGVLAAVSPVKGGHVPFANHNSEVVDDIANDDEEVQEEVLVSSKPFAFGSTSGTASGENEDVSHVGDESDEDDFKDASSEPSTMVPSFGGVSVPPASSSSAVPSQVSHGTTNSSMSSVSATAPTSSVPFSSNGTSASHTQVPSLSQSSSVPSATTTNNTTTTTNPTTTTTTVGGGNSSSSLKKPSNLVAGQSSFLDKPSHQKSVYVAALEKARLAKAQEEQRAANKKREAEAKSTTVVGGNAGGGVKVNQGPVPAHTPSVAANPNPNPNPTPVTAAPATTATSNPNPTSNPTSNPNPNLNPSAVPKIPLSLNKTIPVAKAPAATTATTNATTATAATSATSVKATVPPSQAATTAKKGGLVSSLLNKNKPAATAPATTATTATAATPAQGASFKANMTMPPSTSATAQVPNKVQVPVAVPPATTSIVPTAPAVTATSSAPTPSAAPAGPLREISTTSYRDSAGQEDEEEYQIEDDSDSGSGTDEDEEESAQKHVPEWAKGQRLREALERQYGLDGSTPLDPDLIFPEVQTCNLEEIFGAPGGHNRPYSKRTSSAKWDADSLTLIEKRTYRSQMGYAGAH